MKYENAEIVGKGFLVVYRPVGIKVALKGYSGIPRLYAESTNAD